MNTRIINSKLFAKIKDKKYRDLFIASQINKGVSFQLRALRSARGLTQKDLAEQADTKQTVISRIESKGGVTLSIQSLLKLAYALDVALVVRFEPIDKLVDWVDNLSPEVMAPRLSADILKDAENNVALELIASSNASNVSGLSSKDQMSLGVNTGKGRSSLYLASVNNPVFSQGKLPFLQIVPRGQKLDTAFTIQSQHQETTFIASKSKMASKSLRKAIS